MEKRLRRPRKLDGGKNGACWDMWDLELNHTTVKCFIVFRRTTKYLTFNEAKIPVRSFYIF